MPLITTNWLLISYTLHPSDQQVSLSCGLFTLCLLSVIFWWSERFFFLQNNTVHLYFLLIASHVVPLRFYIILNRPGNWCISTGTDLVPTRFINGRPTPSLWFSVLAGPIQIPTRLFIYGNLLISLWYVSVVKVFLFVFYSCVYTMKRLNKRSHVLLTVWNAGFYLKPQDYVVLWDSCVCMSVCVRVSVCVYVHARVCLHEPPLVTARVCKLDRKNLS